MTPDCSVRIGNILMKNPVTVASGTFGYGSEYARLIDVTRLGAITVKGIRKTPCAGNPTPRIAEVRSGMLNAIGLQGPGAQGFIDAHLPFLRQTGVPVIVNVWGTSLEGYVETAAMFEGVEGIDGLELNVSCPNVKEGGASFGTDPKRMASVISAVRKTTSLTLITKLAPNISDVKTFARAAADAGSDALSISNTLPAMAIDITARKPILANISGGLSGPALHPVALKLVWDAVPVVDIPIIGMGGIMTAADAIAFLCAGATAVAVGTANFIDPTTSIQVIDGITNYMLKHNLPTIATIAIPR